jgi:hypothetical protein
MFLEAVQRPLGHIDAIQRLPRLPECFAAGPLERCAAVVERIARSI